MNDNYLIEYNDIRKLTIAEFLKVIEDTKGKELKELKVRDLSYHNEQLIMPGEGVYIFREKKEILLVGKVSSMSFTERIAKHFDYRPYSWFNRLLYVICCRRLNLEKNEENFKVASRYAFEKLNVVLINFRTRDKINRTERLLRSSTNTLNKFKNLKEGNTKIIVEDY